VIITDCYLSCAGIIDATVEKLSD